MDRSNIIESGGFYFIHNFDSGNLGHVERVPTDLIAPSVTTKNTTETPDYEFNLWTRPDCAGTEFENGNRTWFYFGMQASEPNVLVRLNLINLNKQGKMYNQGMAPVTRTLPGKPQWERIRDRPVHSMDDNTFTISFKYKTPDNLKATTFFAFTYPFSFAELQIALNSIDLKMLPLQKPQSPDEIYYCRECLIYSLEGRRVDLLTITSFHGITNEREERLKNLFPEKQDRPFKFQNKKVIFISARVHPGETPSSFVFNGFLNLILSRNDPIAIQLRKLYVFKMIPFLNPDGVARGHYRTDTRGVNLNRVYLNPSLIYHPTVFASRALIRYYHYGCEKEDTSDDGLFAHSTQDISECSELTDLKKKRVPSTSYKSKNNQSSTTIKQPSEDTKRENYSPSDTTNLVDQVCDLKIQEMQSQTSESSFQPKTEGTGSPSLLNANLLKCCLGSNVHLTTSEELNLHTQGLNPLRPLRDTLKNSISLLMDSGSSSMGVSSYSPTDSKLTNVKIGWCSDCRRAVSQLEDSMPGIAGMVPGFSASAVRSESPTKYQNIEEYREHQRQQIDEQQKAEEEAGKDNVYLCTNCFKRYILTEKNEEIVCESGVSVGAEAGPSAGADAESIASGGDSGDVHNKPRTLHAADSTGDTCSEKVLQVCSPTKPDKPKSPMVRQPRKKPTPINTINKPPPSKEVESGLYLYIDLHGHASKKGIFMYGNHFDDVDQSVECMLLPRIMSLNNLHFHFSSCNFTERNMYLKDRRDGMSREGSGRVAVLKATGLVRSYTLECNYNTGRLVNVLPPAMKDGTTAPPLVNTSPTPPKYTPHIYEEVGRSLGSSILDLTAQHPNSRIPCSEHRSIAAIREWLRAHTRSMKPQLTMSRLRPKVTSPARVPLYARSKAKVTDERKENAYVAARSEPERSRPIRSMPNPEPTRTKRRSVLALRKPNASKTQLTGVTKGKLSRRSADDMESPRSSTIRAQRNVPRALASSSSEELAAGGGSSNWGRDRSLAKRRACRVAPNPPASESTRLKKIRLKSGL